MCLADGRCELPESLFRQQFNAPLKIAIGTPRPETGTETLLLIQQNPNSTNHLCLLMFWFYKFPPKKKEQT